MILRQQNTQERSRRQTRLHYTTDSEQTGWSLSSIPRFLFFLFDLFLFICFLYFSVGYIMIFYEFTMGALLYSARSVLSFFFFSYLQVHSTHFSCFLLLTTSSLLHFFENNGRHGRIWMEVARKGYAFAFALCPISALFALFSLQIALICYLYFTTSKKIY